MPRYDYRCSLCKKEFEFEHSMTSSHEGWDCPDFDFPEYCSGSLNKIIRPAATHFHGQGWGKIYRNHKPKTIE